MAQRFQIADPLRLKIKIFLPLGDQLATSTVADNQSRELDIPGHTEASDDRWKVVCSFENRDPGKTLVVSFRGQFHLLLHLA